MINLSWEILTIAFAGMVIAYSFIVGLNGTVKIILSSYVAILTANAVGNLLSSYAETSKPIIDLLPYSPEQNIVVLKIALFIIITVLLVLKGALAIELSHDRSFFFRFILTGIYGVLSSGLIISTILVFITGGSVEGIIIGTEQAPIVVEGITPFFNTFVKDYNIWFSAPAIVFIVSSLFVSEIESLQG